MPIEELAGPESRLFNLLVGLIMVELSRRGVGAAGTRHPLSII